MDDTIQILVFVVTFIVFIVSAIMQQKKKPNAKSSNFESVVESIFGIPQESPQFQKEVSQNDYFQSEYNESDALQNESFRSRRDNMAKLVEKEGVKGIVDPLSIPEEDSHQEDELALAPFDARQAIIYSEIMNRKYF